MSQDRTKEAYDILVKYHGEGDPNSPFVQAEYAEMIATIQMDMEQKKRTWGELVSTRANMKRCALVAFIGTFSQWSGNGMETTRRCFPLSFLEANLERPCFVLSGSCP